MADRNLGEETRVSRKEFINHQALNFESYQYGSSGIVPCAFSKWRRFFYDSRADVSCLCMVCGVWYGTPT
eukprot:scaffold41745_cov176-Amphora_coffeaeformis.AAC.7